MENLDFADLFSQAKQFNEHFAGVFKEVTGEDFDLETAVKHYPLVSLGLAAAVGVLGGWWVASKQRKSLPPAETHIAERGGTFFERVERIFPGGVESFRRSVPEVPTEKTAAVLAGWMDQVVEPRLKKGLENLTTGLLEGKLGAYLKQTFESSEKELNDDSVSPEG
jgi:hypothetical protein